MQTTDWRLDRKGTRILPSKKGPQYPVKNHGKSTEISKPVIRAILRRFEINEDDFWE